MTEITVTLSSWLMTIMFLAAAIRFARVVEWTLTATAALFLDQTIKLLALAFLRLGETVTVVPGLLSLTCAWNTGVGLALDYRRLFPFLGDYAGVADTLVCAVVTLAVIATAWFTRKRAGLTAGVPTSVGLGLIVGGGLSNAIDRTNLGFVMDYLVVANSAVYNLADLEMLVGICLVCGGVTVAILRWYGKRSSAATDGA